jgi:Glyoxalase-like domain
MVLGYERFGDELIDPHSEGPTFWFQQMDAPRPQRNRIHIDLYIPEDQARARVDAAIAAGGRIVYEDRAPLWWTLADPEGNEVDVASWPGYGLRTGRRIRDCSATCPLSRSSQRDRADTVEVGEHQDVEQLGAWSRPEGVKAYSEPALELVRPRVGRLRRQTDPISG